MLEFGTVVEINEKKSIAVVKILDRETDWLPYLTQANSYKRVFNPIRVGEQVAVLEDALIIGAILNKRCSEPDGNQNKEVTIYEDGTTISYDSKKSLLEIKCVKSLTLTAPNITIKGSNVRFIGGTITHDEVVIDKTHVHPQNSGNHFGGDVDTNPPKG